MSDTLQRLHRLERLLRIRALHEDGARLLLEVGAAEERALAAQQDARRSTAANARAALLQSFNAVEAPAGPAARLYAEDEGRRATADLERTEQARRKAQARLPALQQNFHARRVEREQMQSLCDSKRAALREQQQRAHNAEADELAAQKLLRDRRKAERRFA